MAYGDPGCFYYVGETQSGKTKKAHADLKADILASGRPALVLDPMPAWNFADLKHEPTVEAVAERLWKDRTHAVYTPEFPKDVERLMKALREVGGVHVLWDECSFHMSWRTIGPETSKALRGWWHSKNTFRLVTQSPGDLHGDAYKVAPTVYAFRTTRVACLDRLEAEFNFNPEHLKILPDNEFVTRPERRS